MIVSVPYHCLSFYLTTSSVLPAVWVIVSSAYMSMTVCKWIGMSFIDIRNRTGPSTDP